MSGSNGPPGQRALFANAPVTPAPQTIPVVPSGSNLAAAMMNQGHGMNLQAPSFGGAIPLSSLMSLGKQLQQPSNPTPGNNQTGLVRGADGSWVAGPSMGGEMPSLSWANGAAPQQAQAPGMPTAGAPGLASPGAPGTPGQTLAPGMPSQGAPGTGGADQPGLFGQTMSWLQSLYGNGGGGG